LRTWQRLPDQSADPRPSPRSPALLARLHASALQFDRYADGQFGKGDNHRKVQIDIQHNATGFLHSWAKARPQLAPANSRLTSSKLFRTPILRIMFARWTSTVRGEDPIASAISFEVKPFTR
jgi:hypothetical protein